MPLDLTEVVQVSISISAPRISARGFGRPLILGTTDAIAPDAFRLYTSLESVAADYATTDPEYIEAQHIFAQQAESGRSVRDILIGYWDGVEALADRLTAIKAAGAEWYATIFTGRTQADLEAIATWTETEKKIALLQTADTAVKDTAWNAGSPGADVGSQLKANGRNRTALFYHATAEEGLASALAGYALPFSPGTLTWGLKPLADVVASSLTDTEYANLTGTAESPKSGKNVNVYVPIHSELSILQRGLMASGRWIDHQRTVDYLQNQIEVGIVNLLATRPKVPFTEEGIESMAAVFRGVLAAGERDGILDPNFEPIFNIPLPSDVSAANRSNRVLDPPITAQHRLAGAVHFTKFELTLEV